MNPLRRSVFRRRPGIGAWVLASLFLPGPMAAASQNFEPQPTPPVDSGMVPAQAEESPPRMTAEEIQRYNAVKSLIDWTPEQIQDRPELRDLQPAESQQNLPAILSAAGERVSALFDDFPNMTSVEEVRAGPCDEGLRKKCRVTYRGRFNYLVVAHPTENDRLMGEYRTDLKGRFIDYRNIGHGRILLTSGFTTTPLQHFRPQNQMACRFRYFGRQDVAGQKTDVVGFVEIPGKYLWPTDWRNGKAVVPLCLQGLAWIDVTSYQIVRIETFLVAPPPKGDFQSDTTQVEFGEIRLHQATVVLRLPTEVVVDVWFHQRHFRNVHKYSGFKLFQVETHIGPMIEK